MVFDRVNPTSHLVAVGGGSHGKSYNKFTIKLYDIAGRLLLSNEEHLIPLYFSFSYQ